MERPRYSPGTKHAAPSRHSYSPLSQAPLRLTTISAGALGRTAVIPPLTPRETI
ncbi:hypothetical protein M378DRAFT_160643, partial [Amanita muscaria Koide BX008]